ncbi:unnamed protein product [Closterium sp. Naga37s-1]|nr:unnamed protein product [Closterium sp. Naga37s-1]
MLCQDNEKGVNGETREEDNGAEEKRAEEERRKTEGRKVVRMLQGRRWTWKDFWEKIDDEIDSLLLPRLCPPLNCHSPLKAPPPLHFPPPFQPPSTMPRPLTPLNNASFQRPSFVSSSPCGTRPQPHCHPTAIAACPSLAARNVNLLHSAHTSAPTDPHTLTPTTHSGTHHCWR